MREAMARAQVDDDVLGHDPTMAALEERVAELAGKQAAIWVPSGCMSNLVAMMCHVTRGDRVIAPRHAHVFAYELGTVSWLAGAIAVELDWTLGPGVPSPEDVAREATSGRYYALRTTLLALENTHNHAGGTIVPPDVYAELVATAHERGLAVHLDGARLWHAAAAQGLTVAQAVGEADTVSLCLSKGLAAPMGSVLAGSTELVARARRFRKMLGGGVRQGGVVAAAGLVALEDELPRVDEDRHRAIRLAQGLREMGYEVGEVHTNMAFVANDDAAGLAATWTQAGVACVAMGSAVRLVTHREIDDASVTEALERIRAVTK